MNTEKKAADQAARSAKTKDLQFHPAANLLPLLDGADFDTLVDDIREHGLLTNIELYEGQILDGRNRYRACLHAGVEPDTINVDEVVTDPYLHVASLNLHRRHLTDDQRAVVANEIVKARSAAAVQARNKKTANTRADRQGKEINEVDKTTTTLNDEPKVKTRAAVAKETKVPESKLRDIAAIEKADPDLHKQVAAGEVTIREAKAKLKPKGTDGCPVSNHNETKLFALQCARCAITQIERIPKSNSGREEAFSKVEKWIQSQRGLEGSPSSTAADWKTKKKRETNIGLSSEAIKILNRISSKRKDYESSLRPILIWLADNYPADEYVNGMCRYMFRHIEGLDNDGYDQQIRSFRELTNESVDRRRPELLIGYVGTVPANGPTEK